MTAFTISEGPWTPGTLVKAYLSSALPAGAAQPSGAPLDTDTADANGGVTFEGLEGRQRYVAWASSRAVRFAVPADGSQAGARADRERIEALEGGSGSVVSVETLALALNDVLETEDGWPDRPTLDGDAIPWSLRWRSLPGSVVNPAEKMAEFDTYLPVPEEG